jgi:hypothetical protein
MNYYGVVTDEAISAGDVYRFLQKAMQNVTADRPFRGSGDYREGDFRYHDESEGDLNQFSGKEIIFLQDRQVYVLTYQGGKIG